MANQSNTGLTFDEFNLIVDKSVASISDDIDAIVDKVWAEIDQKEQGKQ